MTYLIAIVLSVVEEFLWLLFPVSHVILLGVSDLKPASKLLSLLAFTLRFFKVTSVSPRY